MRLTPNDYHEIDARLAGHDRFIALRSPGDAPGRQPVHTVYIPADRIAGFRRWGAQALAALNECPPLPFPAALPARVRAKLATEPIEDLRVDFEDGYGVRDDDQEDAAVKAAVAVLAEGPRPPFLGIRIKSLEAATRRRSLRTLDHFLSLYQEPFTVTLPKVSGPDQVTAMVALCELLERGYGLTAGTLTFEIQI